MFGKAVAIERRSVEKIDAQPERAFHRIDGRVVIQLHEEIAKRRGSESQDRNLKPRPSKGTAWHCKCWFHIDRLFSAPCPAATMRLFFILLAR